MTVYFAPWRLCVRLFLFLSFIFGYHRRRRFSHQPFDHVLGGHPLAHEKSTDLGLAAAAAHDQPVAVPVRSGLDEQRGVEDRDRRPASRGVGLDASGDLGQDLGMDDRVERLPGGGVAEHALREPTANDPAVVVQDLPAEALDDLAVGSLPRLEYLVRQVVALQDFDLTIHEEPAMVTTIAGESGSGKTTLANLILGFIGPTSGQIFYKGQDVATMTAEQGLQYRQEVQAVFQDPYEVYNPFYRIKHIFDLVIKRFGLARNKREAREVIEEALNVVGMLGEELLEKYPHQLSGGQRQRMMVARAFMLQPRLIVADEPVSMVDASLRAMILDIMLRMRDEYNISFLYITHDLSTAYQIGDQIHIRAAGPVVGLAPMAVPIGVPRTVQDA